MTLPKIWPKQEKKEPEYFVRFFPGGCYDEETGFIAIAAIVDEDGASIDGCILLAQGRGRVPSVEKTCAEKAGVRLDRSGQWEEAQCFDTLFSVTELKA